MYKVCKSILGCNRNAVRCCASSRDNNTKDKERIDNNVIFDVCYDLQIDTLWLFDMSLVLEDYVGSQLNTRLSNT